MTTASPTSSGASGQARQVDVEQLLHRDGERVRRVAASLAPADRAAFWGGIRRDLGVPTPSPAVHPLQQAQTQVEAALVAAAEVVVSIDQALRALHPLSGGAGGMAVPARLRAAHDLAAALDHALVDALEEVVDRVIATASPAEAGWATEHAQSVLVELARRLTVVQPGTDGAAR
jgi:hypothetical protein